MSLCEKYREHMTDNGREIMDRYGAGGRITKPELYIPNILHSYYSAIAFLGGTEKAADFLDMFSGAPGICFMAEGKYFIENEMFSDVIHSSYLYGMEEGDSTSREILMLALMRSGEFENALLRVKNMLNAHMIDQPLLNHLQALTHCKNARVAAEATDLYEKQIALYDEYVDLDDLRRTGLAFNDVKKRDRQRLASLTPDELESELASDIRVADHITHYIALEQGAKIYESKDMDAMALRCFIRLRVCGYKSKQTTGNLARLFGKLGNKVLSHVLYEIADIMPEAPDENPTDALPFYGTESAEVKFARAAVVKPVRAKSKSGSKKRR
jgi:hypothetical protein